MWWLVDTEGLQMVSLCVEAAGFVVLDLVAKVGFGIILLSSRARRRRLGDGTVGRPIDAPTGR